MLSRRTPSRIPPLLITAAMLGCGDGVMPTEVAPGSPSLNVTGAATCVVTSTADAGAGSLRAMIGDESCSTITFSVTGVITLTTGQLVVDRSVTMIGPDDAPGITISGNQTTRVFSVSGPRVEMVRLTIAHGRGEFLGGGFYNTGHLTLTQVTVRDNVVVPVPGEASYGGGIFTHGTLLVRESTIAGNVATGGVGGGISARGATVHISGSTISGNSASAIGAIEFASTGSIQHSTVTGNSAGSVGGIQSWQSPIAIRGSIIAGNHDTWGNPDLEEPYAGRVSITRSLIGSASGNSATATVANGNIVNAAPLLGPLASNGGATKTHAVLADSPARDAGTCTNAAGVPVVTDQRGFSRPVETGCDVGAFEFGASPPPADDTAPVITSTVTGTQGTSGWYTGDVTVTWMVVDAESAITTPACAATTIATDVAAQVVSCGATSAGGTASASVTIRRDATAPTLAPTISPNPVLLNGTATALPNATDATSGILSASCDAVATHSVGVQYVACRARDNAGNSNTAIVSYTVAHAFGGFAAPVSSSSVNRARAGQTIPLKWRLLDANGAPVTTLATATVTAATLACDLNATPNELTETASNSSGLQNLGDGYYQYNWSTPKSYANSCKTVQLDLGYGVVGSAGFRFER